MADKENVFVHPFFREKVKEYKHKEFERGVDETIQDVLDRAREWRLENKNINVAHGRWSMQPITDEDKRGPSSFKQVFTISYTE